MTNKEFVYMHYCGRDDCDCVYLSRFKETPEDVKCANMHVAHEFDGKTVRYKKDKEV